MSPRSRNVVAAAVALGTLVAIDLAIARVDVFGLLARESHPTTFFAGVNSHLIRAVRSLYARPEGPRAVVLLGNSLFADAGGPAASLAAALAARGAPAETPVLSLCVLATYPTDDEVLARQLAPVRPGLVLIGLGVTDLGTSLERARAPIAQLLDTGFADGLVPPADGQQRLERWVRTVWRLYRYRTLLRELVLWPGGPSIPAATLDRELRPDEFFAIFFGRERGAELVALRAEYDRRPDFATLRRYLELLRGPDYLAGVRSRWRDLRIDPLQVEALRLTSAHARAAGAQPVWVLLPENPALGRDAEVGALVRERSGEVAERLAAEAGALGLPLLDLRRTLPESSFVDLNHVFFNSGAFLPVLADALADGGLLAPVAVPPASSALVAGPRGLG